MGILAVGSFRRQFFKPLFKVGVEAGFVIVDEDAGADVHGVAEQKPFRDAACA